MLFGVLFEVRVTVRARTFGRSAWCFGALGVLSGVYAGVVDF